MLGVQDAKTFEYINDPEDDDGIADSMVVDIPIDSIFVVLLWP